MLHAAIFTLALTPGAMYRKGLAFGSKPAFRELVVGEGSVSCGQTAFPCQYARFGAVDALSGRLVTADPPTAHAPLANRAAVDGCIAVVTRGACSFEAKLRQCEAAGAIGVCLVNAEDERFVAAPDPVEDPAAAPPMPDIPLVVVASSDGASLMTPGAEATIAPLPLEDGLPIFPMRKPLLPGASIPLMLGDAERAALAAHFESAASSPLVAVVMADKEAALAQTGALATIDLKGTPATLTAVRPCNVLSLLRSSTPEQHGLALCSEVTSDAGASEEASKEFESMCAALDVGAKSSDPEWVERLSYALCGLIALTPKHEQAALEMAVPTRLKALHDQLNRNPKRGAELLQQAIDAVTDEAPVAVPTTRRSGAPSMSAATSALVPARRATARSARVSMLAVGKPLAESALKALGVTEGVQTVVFVLGEELPSGVEVAISRFAELSTEIVAINAEKVAASPQLRVVAASPFSAAGMQIKTAFGGVDLYASSAPTSILIDKSGAVSALCDVEDRAAHVSEMLTACERVANPKYQPPEPPPPVEEAVVTDATAGAPSEPVAAAAEGASADAASSAPAEQQSTASRMVELAGSTRTKQWNKVEKMFPTVYSESVRERGESKLADQLDDNPAIVPALVLAFVAYAVIDDPSRLSFINFGGS